MERVFQVPRQRLAVWLQEEADTLPSLETTLAEPREDDVLELDELWSFVQKKSNKRWVWIALLGRTRQIVAYGNRFQSVTADCKPLVISGGLSKGDTTGATPRLGKRVVADSPC